MKVSDVYLCSFTSWYEKFKSCTPSSIVLSLPLNVLEYLLDDGTLVLPDEQNIIHEENSEGWDTPTVTAPNLQEFSEKISSTIKRLGGSVFPKLNWSSPKDASWITFNKSLQCFNPSDVYLLLKSSDFITHDLISPFENCEDVNISTEKCSYCLVLRKWIEINPSDEFRCFVKNKRIIGISQRDTSQHYNSIKIEENSIVYDIVAFWKENICHIFELESYVFDVHRPAKGIVSLIDFNPFGSITDALMFSWDELEQFDTEKCSLSKIGLEKLTVNGEHCMSNKELKKDSTVIPTLPEFRYVSNETGIQPSSYMQYGLPADIIDWSASATPGAFSQLLKSKTQGQSIDCSSDEESEETEAHCK